ncbi:MAG: protein phosphatase CheZ [SAR324 cluster bacterium]|nr:protein phosphatase CheZ [SAR324 cluster bacterium]
MQQLPKGSREYRATFSMLDKMREFFQIMQEANSQELDQIMAEFDLSEQPLVQELGKLVRRLHTQIKLAGSDVAARLGEIAEHDMVSATERLEHIVHMTEDAANTTLNLAEGMIKRSTEQESANGAILERLEKTLGAGKLRPQTKKPLLEAVDALRRQAEQEKEFQEKLTEILMAQGYQDLTGQVVQRVVTLLQQLEGELLELVKAFGTTRAEKKQDTRQAELAGPLSEKSEATVSQDQVDNLLESLGF